MAHENVYFPNETRNSKLVDENAKCRVLLEWSYNYLRLAAACSKIGRTSVKVGMTRLLLLVKAIVRVQERISEQTFSWTPVGRALIQNCWGSLRRLLVNKQALQHCMYLLFEHFYKKIKRPIINVTAQLVVFGVALLNYKDVRANCFGVSLLRT